MKYLSGGEKQRLAIARAVSKKNEVLLMDEPTGNLDSSNSKEIMKILKTISHEKLVIVVTHDKELVYEFGDYYLSLYDGKMVKFQEIIENGIDIEMNDSVPAYFLNVIRNNSFLKTKEVILIGGDFKKKFVLPNENRADYFLSLLSNFPHQKLKIRFIEEETETNVSDGRGISTLNLKSQFAYASHLMFRKVGRTITSTLILSFSIGLLLLHASLVFFNKKSAMENAFQYLDTTLVPLHREKKIEGIIKECYRGKEVHSEISNEFGNAIPVFAGELSGINPNLNIYIAAIDKPISFCGQTIDPPKGKSVVISSFLSAIAKTKTIQFDLSRHIDCAHIQPITMNVSRIIDVNYDKQLLDAFSFGSSYSNQDSIIREKQDVFMSRYMLAFASIDDFRSAISKETTYFYLYGNELPIMNTSSTDYIYRNQRYGLYRHEKMAYGKAPTKMDEVTISEDFAKSLINTNEKIKIEDIIGKYYSFEDFKKFENNDLAYFYPNMYDVVHGVTIVGIHESSGDVAEILSSPSLYQKMADEVFEFPKQYYAYSDSRSFLADKLSKSKYISSYDSMRIIYSFEKTLQNVSFLEFLFGLGFSFLALGVLFLNLFCNLNVKEKRHEIATMKSLGISSKRISSIFLIENGFVLLVSFLFGVILSLIGIHFGNGLFKNMGTNSVSYNLLTFSPFICFIAFLFVLLLSSCSTILPMLKTRRLDIVSSLKESK